MSYAVYTTRGFILGSAPNGEASKVYTIYTEDFGLVRAKAQGVRLLASKLRYNLDDFAFGSFSFVRGKELWRLTGAETASLGPENAPLRARILTLVRRLVQGEERNDGLFKALMPLTDQAAVGKDAEVRILAAVLAALGYLDLDEAMALPRSEAVALINKALKESQL
jgi:recombinational DNA repair protein (RecF pathway)